MRSASALPPAIAALLGAFPYDVLYGSIAADTSIAKKYAPAGRHCHAWNVGQEIFERAHDEPLRAFALGYLAHLAADVVMFPELDDPQLREERDGIVTDAPGGERPRVRPRRPTRGGAGG